MPGTDLDFQRYATFSLSLFQLTDGRRGIGLHSKGRGLVWRWDGGLLRKPTLIHWRAPHCGNDTCGSPCEHRENEGNQS